jgi:hypothetical protein
MRRSVLIAFACGLAALALVVLSSTRGDERFSGEAGRVADAVESLEEAISDDDAEGFCASYYLEVEKPGRRAVARPADEVRGGCDPASVARDLRGRPEVDFEVLDVTVRGSTAKARVRTSEGGKPDGDDRVGDVRLRRIGDRWLIRIEPS